MKTVESKIVEKIRKLLALSQSSNEHEAALAASRAQALMLEHKISVSELKDPTATSAVDEGWVTESMGKFTYMTWKGVLVSGIAALNSCQCLRFDGNRLKLVGRKEDREVVEYLACFLIREIERLAFENYAASGFRDNGKRWTWVQSFGLGATTIILRRMREEKNRIVTQNVSVTALVKRDDQALQSYLSVKYPKLKNAKANNKIDSEAYGNGRSAGHSISWHSAVKPAAESRRIA